MVFVARDHVTVNTNISNTFTNPRDLEHLYPWTKTHQETFQKTSEFLGNISLNMQYESELVLQCSRQQPSFGIRFGFFFCAWRTVFRCRPQITAGRLFDFLYINIQKNLLTRLQFDSMSNCCTVPSTKFTIVNKLILLLCNFFQSLSITVCVTCVLRYSL